MANITFYDPSTSVENDSYVHVQNFGARSLAPAPGVTGTNTLPRPNCVDQSCLGHGSDSTGSYQGDPISSLTLALAPAAGRQRNIGRKRPRGDGSGAEDNDRGGKRRNIAAGKSKATLVECPFKERYPNNPEFRKCGPFDDWNRLREHLLSKSRKHSPRDRCPTCGKIFLHDVEWNEHTSKRACRSSSQPLDSPSWVNSHQAAEIRKLSSRGVKNELSLSELCHKVYGILFNDDEITSAGPESGHQILYPHVQHRDIDDGLQNLAREFANVLCKIVADHARPHIIDSLIDCVRRYEGSVERTEAGGPALDDYCESNGAGLPDWMVPAGPSQGQMSRVPGPVRYYPGPSEGPLGPDSNFLQRGASDPALPPYFIPTEFTSGSGAGNEAVVPGSSFGHDLENTLFPNYVDMSANLTTFDNVDPFGLGEYGDMGQLVGGVALVEDETRDAPR